MFKVLSLFSGVGAFEKSFKNLNIPYEIVNYCEWDKYASKAYSILHNVPQSLNLGDITQVNEKTIPHYDIQTWGFPCTDLSSAGPCKGLWDENGNPTRSGLYFHGLRILAHNLPKYSIIENVPTLVKRFRKELDMILQDLSNLGYQSTFKVLNAINFGIPQQRKRIFIVSVRNGNAPSITESQKDPLPIKNFVYHKNGLEKYYISSQPDTSHIQPNNIVAVKNQGKTILKKIDIAYTLLTRDYKGFGNQETNGFVDPSGKLRRLTPEEYCTLMGFTTNDYTILKNAKISDTQIYRMMGNSIVVPVLESILTNLVTTI